MFVFCKEAGCAGGIWTKILATGLRKPTIKFKHASSWVSYLCDPLLCDAVRCHVQLQQCVSQQSGVR